MNGIAAWSAAAVTGLAVITGLACARQDAGGTGFDYYLLSLSWSPQYCAETRRSGEPQCTRPYAFVVHGLWPQNERGYPRECPSGERVEDATIKRLLPIMPSRGLIIHEWRSHGACTGLNPEAYFSTVERAWRSIRIPAAYQTIDDYRSLEPAELKRDLIAANPKIPQRGLALQCSGRFLKEVWLCLDPQLSPRACGADVRDRCEGSVVLRPVR